MRHRRLEVGGLLLGRRMSIPTGFEDGWSGGLGLGKEVIKGLLGVLVMHVLVLEGILAVRGVIDELTDAVVSLMELRMSKGMVVKLEMIGVLRGGCIRWRGHEIRAKHGRVKKRRRVPFLYRGRSR